MALSSILAVKGALSVFEIPYVMTRGMNGSSTFVIQTVKEAFELNKVGLASAMAVILLVLIVIVTAIQNILLNDREKTQKLCPLQNTVQTVQNVRVRNINIYFPEVL